MEYLAIKSKITFHRVIVAEV